MILHCLPSIIVETGENPTHSIIWLHGLGADGHDFEPIVAQLNLPKDLAIRFIFPHAPSMPVSINNGYVMPAWYDISHNDLGIQHDESGVRQSANQIQLLIDQEIMHGIPASNIVIAGFSQGGAMALHCGLRQTEALGGIIALSCYILLPDHLEKERLSSTSQTPIFIGHGVEDSIVSFNLGDTAQRTLNTWGHSITWHTYPMEHSVCPAEIQHIGQWISNLFKYKN